MRQLQFLKGNNFIEIGQGQNSPFLLTKVEGLGYSTNVHTSKSLYQDGESYSGSDLNMRNITIQLAIKDNIQDNISRLYETFSPSRSIENLGEFRYIEGDVKRKCKVEIESVDTKKEKGFCIAFISLIAPDPFFYDLQNTINTMATWEKAFYFPVPYGIKPVIFGFKNKEQIKNIINRGSTETPLIINFTNNYSVDIKRPKIINVVTREFFEVDITLKKGDILKIDTLEKKVMLNDKNIFSKRIRGSKFFNLNVGDNYLQFDAETNAENLEVFLEYNSRFLGV